MRKYLCEFACKNWEKPVFLSSFSLGQGNCCFNLRDAFERMQNGSKLMPKVRQKRGVRVGIFYRKLNPIPLGGVNMFLHQDYTRPPVSKFQYSKSI